MMVRGGGRVCVCVEEKEGEWVCGGVMMVRGGGRVCVCVEECSTEQQACMLSPLGQLVHVYTELPLHRLVSAVAYHPHEHTAAFTAFGPHQPLVLATVDPHTPSHTQHTPMSQ